MASNPTAALTVDIIGANQRLQDTLVMVFRGPANGICTLAQNDNAQAVIVNLDGVGASDEWTRYRARYPNRPAIVLSLNGEPVEHAAQIVAKPVRIDAFVDAVKSVQSSLAASNAAPLPGARALPAKAADQTVERAPSAPGPTTTPNAPTEVLTASIRSKASTDVACTPAPLVEHDALAEALCGNAPDIDIEDAQAVERVHHDTHGYLLHHVCTARKLSLDSNSPVAVLMAKRPAIVIDAARNLAWSTMSSDDMTTLAARPLREAQLEPCRGNTAPEASSRDLNAVLWTLALSTYRGRLPAQAPLHERAYLRHWPNFTRLFRTPNAMRIAALLIQQPMQLVRVAEVLRIPQRHVFAFYAAAETIGLAGPARRASDNLMAQESPPPDERHDLIERIARHLPHTGSVNPEGAGS